VDDHIDALPAARHHADAVLVAAEANLDRGSLPEHLKRFEYSIDGLEARLMQIYDLQRASYRPAKGAKKTPGELRKDILQATLIGFADGMWGQYFGYAGIHHSEVAARMFHIYADEIGNGEVAQNHHVVYRRVLDEIGVAAPDVAAPELIAAKWLPEEAFDTPLFWLAIGQFPRDLLPELLGLNLYNELNGVGGFFMTMSDEFRRHGVNPYFWDLHNSIDNLATGHTRMAIDAVELYLDEVFALAGPATRDAHWRRVWNGFVAVPTVTSAAAVAAAGNNGASGAAAQGSA
jgi:hypothetical protein